MSDSVKEWYETQLAHTLRLEFKAKQQQQKKKRYLWIVSICLTNGLINNNRENDLLFSCFIFDKETSI